jgi:hypothetical protein
MRYLANVNCGALTPCDPAVYSILLTKLKPGRYVVTVEREQEARRSIPANRYWFGRVVEPLRELWSRARRTHLGLPPYTQYEAHSTLVQIIKGSEPGPLPGSVLHVPTCDADQKWFSDLIDHGRALAWDEYQINIPPAGEPDSEGP